MERNIYKIGKELFITSDEEIKNGDWVFNFEYDYIVQYDCKKHDDKFWYKKIILTTDQSLDGVQAIEDEFLEWFVKNPSCEEVYVEEEDYSQKCRECGETVKRGYNCKKGCFMKSGNFIPTDKNIKYKIIIPTEEPKTNLEKLPFSNLVKEFAEYYKNVPLVEESKQETERESVCNCGLKESEHNVRHPFIPRLEPKQETLEEAALKYSDGNTLEFAYMQEIPAFKAGAKWQQNDCVKFINELEDDSFAGWSEEAVKGYLTACITIKNKLKLK